jgi:hypothetical protein
MYILVENVNKAEEVPLKIISSIENEVPKMSKRKEETNTIFISFWKILIHRIYILSWIRDYDREKAIADLIAGITLGLTVNNEFLQ